MYDSIVIGGGPAGLTTALYLLRAGKSVLVLEKEAPGGQIAKSPRLENFPSIKAISGMDFSSELFDQVTDLGADFELENGVAIEKEGDVFKVKTDWGEHEGKTVVIATGCEHRHLGLPREEELTGHGISYCAVCDGAFYKDEDVLLIGDANTAIQYAISLSQTSRKVTVATLFDRFFADDILVKRMKGIPNIEYFHNLESKEFLGKDQIEGVRFEDTKTHEEKIIPCKGCFIAIGQVPCNEPFQDWVDLDKGFIVTDDSMRTKTPGIYAVGDCRVKKIRQVITATSDGAIAAIAIANELNVR